MTNTSTEAGEEFLEHYGVLGMHWGIRRDPKTGVRPIAKSLDESRLGKLAKSNAQRHMDKQNLRATKKQVKKESSSLLSARQQRKETQKWDKGPSRKDYNRAFGKAGDAFVNELPSLKSDPRFAGKKVRGNSPTAKAYRSAAQQLMQHHLDIASRDLPVSPNGTQRFRLVDDGKHHMPVWTIVPNEIEHADDSPVKVKLKFDDDGFIIGVSFDIPEDIGGKPLAQSTEDGEEFLEHYGIKGMHWGIRRDLDTGVRPIAKSLNDSRFGSAANKNAQRHMDKQTAKAEKKAEKKYVKQATSAKGYVQDYNAMSDRMNSTEIARINNDPRFKDHDMSYPSSVRDEYYAEYSKTATRILREASAKRVGSTSPSGNLQVKWIYDVGRDQLPTMMVVDNRILQHAGTVPGMECKLEITWTKDGHISKITVPAKPLVQSTEDGEDFVEHYGVKGMHWGIRRDRGRDDLSGLSNEELRQRVDRMRLEQSYNSIKSSSSKGKGLDYVKKHLGTIATITASVVTLASATGKGRNYLRALQQYEVDRLKGLAAG